MSTRQDFEEWFGAPQTLERQSDGNYKYHAADTAWQVWQASAEVEREACIKLATKEADDWSTLRDIAVARKEPSVIEATNILAINRCIEVMKLRRSNAM